MKAHALYLHGFGSGPLTAKGTALGARLREAVASYGIPDLEGGDFPGLTMTAIIQRARAAISALPDDGAPVLLIGSSLGGYTAAIIAGEDAPPRVRALLLIAPAFGFPGSWRTRLGEAGIAAWRAAGSRPFFHHGQGQELPLGVGFLESCERLPDLPAQSAVPVSIVHGRQDETVSWQQSLRYVQTRRFAELHLIDGNHRLTAPRHEELIAWCARDLLSRLD